MTLAVLLMGQSQASGVTAQTGGTHYIASGVHAWNSADPMSDGSAWIPAQYGVGPLTIGSSPWAVNPGITFANRIRQLSGADVYLILKAKGSQAIETFIKPATLAANGWTAAADNTVFMYPDIAQALAAIPGCTKTVPDFILWMQGGANASDTQAQYQAKLTALISDMTAEGIYRDQASMMIAGGLRDTTSFKETHKAACLAAGLRYATGEGYTLLPDGLHLIGEDSERFGTRLANSVWLQGAGNFMDFWTPEYTYRAPVGSKFRRTDGGATTTVYVKEGGGTGNTGWAAK